MVGSPRLMINSQQGKIIENESSKKKRIPVVLGARFGLSFAREVLAAYQGTCLFPFSLRASMSSSCEVLEKE